MKIRWLHDAVLVEEEADPEHWDREGVIIAPEAHAHDTLRGRVVAVGKAQKYTADGVPRPTTLRVGDVVRFLPVSGVHLTIAGKAYRVLREYGERGPLCIDSSRPFAGPKVIASGQG